MELSGQIAAGISLQLLSARRWAAQDGAIQAGTPSDGRSCRRSFVHVRAMFGTRWG
jgi:hypothetical protein